MLMEGCLQQLFAENLTNLERHRKDKRGERMPRRLMTEILKHPFAPQRGRGWLEVDNAARFSGGRLGHDGNIAQCLCLDLV